jgi:hypothetical protein
VLKHPVKEIDNFIIDVEALLKYEELAKCAVLSAFGNKPFRMRDHPKTRTGSR